MLSGSVLGMAERGLKFFIEHTSARRNSYGVVKAENAGMQRRIAESSAEIAEARRLLENICQRFDIAMAEDQAPMPAVDRVQFRWDAAYIVELSRRAIERVFAASGAHGVYEIRYCGPIATYRRQAIMRSSILIPCPSYGDERCCSAISTRIPAPRLSHDRQ
jgi:alkylation response protein AidB-like acyl-CoA dehydrogenase